jgi:hypothetical protein
MADTQKGRFGLHVSLFTITETAIMKSMHPAI